MPDIFKKQEFVESDDSVQIPDMETYGSFVAEDGALEETLQPPPGAETGDESVVAVPRLASVSHQTRPFSKEEVEALYARELEKIRQVAADEAYSAAFQQVKGEFKDCISRVDNTLAELQRMQEDYVKEYTRELKFLAVDIAEKIMLQKIEANDLSLNALVLQAVSAVKHSKWLSVDLSERLVYLVDYMKEELRKPEYHGRAEVNPMACPDDTCRVVTEDGTIVSTITVQTDNLREAFANAAQE